jgi:hypothetical protein
LVARKESNLAQKSVKTEALYASREAEERTGIRVEAVELIQL